ncbi:MAG: hypothetical protein PHP57_06470 [Sideroxydans sp.]|nr:hypothetical protein [Sideroxydans sp.]
MLKGLFGIALVAAFWNHYGQPLDTSNPEAFATTLVSTAPAVKASAQADFEAKALPKIKQAVKDFDRGFTADIARANANFQRAEQAGKPAVAEVVKPAYFLSSNPNTTFKYCYHFGNNMTACYGEPLVDM